MKTTRDLFLALVLLSGCSSEGSTPAGPEVTGTFFGNALVELFPSDMYATFSAQFFDAPPPPIHAVEVKQEGSGCQLLTPVLCDPVCAVGSYCSNEKKCVARPAPIGVGTLTVTGLSGMTLPLEPMPPMNNYSGPTLQPFPPCTEGADVTVKSDKFNAGIKCITPLVLTSAVPIPVMSGQPTHFTWTPPAKAGTSRILIELEIAHHGGYTGQIDCDVADTGSFDIPASLVTGLVSRGLAGYPTVAVSRVSTAAAANEPGAKLTMPSRVEVEVDTGVHSCGAASSPPCPSGQACDDNLKICK